MTRTVLTHKQSFELANYTKAQYEVLGFTDREFAVYASQALGFHVNSNNVATSREVVGIQATRDTRREKGDQTLGVVLERLQVLESTVEDLERKVAALQQSAKIGGRL